MTEPQSGDCSASALFERAMGLIDPPRWSTVTNNHDSSQGDDSKDALHQEMCDDESSTEPVVKRVKFDESTTCFAPRTVTAADAIQAYDLLVQAASMSSSLLRQDLTRMDWNKLQNIADIYRALLVTTCLLLELLLSKEITESAPQIIDASKEQTCQQTKTENSPLVQTAIDHIPALSPAIEQGLLSTARRAILLLQALERICAEKSVAENIGRGGCTNLFSAGGDDIHDYDRSETDFVSNYDWHDDGFLPAIQDSSVLRECCHLRKQQDPPCSKFERNAWTRYWVRDERLVSMNFQDYTNGVQYDDAENLSKDIEAFSRREGDVALHDMSETNHDNECFESYDNIALSEGSRTKRRRTTNIPAMKQTALVEDRNDIVKEGFLLFSCDVCGVPHDSHDNATSKRIGFRRVYCKLHPSGWLSIEDRSIRLKTDEENPLAHRKCLKYFIYSETICQPCIPNGTMSFHFRLDAVRYLGSSMLFNHEYEAKDSPTKNDPVACKLLFAVDDEAGSTFADGFEWVNALSGAAAKASSLRDQIRLEWQLKLKHVCT